MHRLHNLLNMCHKPLRWFFRHVFKSMSHKLLYNDMNHIIHMLLLSVYMYLLREAVCRIQIHLVPQLSHLWIRIQKYHNLG
jgi:hypothetical protein